MNQLRRRLCFGGEKSFCEDKQQTALVSKTKRWIRRHRQKHWLITRDHCEFMRFSSQAWLFFDVSAFYLIDSSLLPIHNRSHDEKKKRKLIYLFKKSERQTRLQRRTFSAHKVFKKHNKSNWYLPNKNTKQREMLSVHDKFKKANVIRFFTKTTRKKC